MEKSVKISIPQPCMQAWSGMKPANEGRFCESCSKIVVDFTQMTDKEIASYFLNHSARNICGHFNRRQITTATNKLTNTLLNWYCNIYNAKQSLFRSLVLIILSGILTLAGCTDEVEGKIETHVLGDTVYVPTDSLNLKATNSTLDKADTVHHLKTVKSK